jgi:uncharacterized cupin superfamily protein
MEPSVVFGNAHVAGANRRGWFLGHFVDPSSDRLRSTSDLEVKWGMHTAGASRTEWSTNESATTLAILISGRFCLRFPDQEVLLAREGDYAIWTPGTPHSWTAEEASTVLTVRWPSLPEDTIEEKEEEIC